MQEGVKQSVEQPLRTRKELRSTRTQTNERRKPMNVRHTVQCERVKQCTKQKFPRTSNRNLDEINTSPKKFRT